MKNLNDYIVVMEDALPHSLCDAIIQEFGHDGEWSQTVIGSGHVDRTIRSAETVVLSYPSVISKNLDIRQALDMRIFSAAADVILRYKEKFPLCRIQQDSGYELLRYQKGQFYTQHTDAFKDVPRAVSCSFALNDDYDGGEWGFFNRELVFKIPKGSAVLFPSNFLYPHEIMPVTSGTRYSIVTWFA